MIGKTNALTTNSSDKDKELVKSIIERTVTELTIPSYITKIGERAFSECENLINITIPSTIDVIEDYAFSGCANLTSVTIPPNVTTIVGASFSHCGKLTRLIISNGVKSIDGYTFWDCLSLTTVTIPSSLTYVFSGIFHNCTSLNDVTIENGFNCNYLNLSVSTLYATETIVSWLEALADRTGERTYTLTIGADNLAKLTEEQIAIATAKNWTLA